MAYAVSALSTTLLMWYVAPRSICRHCRSQIALDHRLPVLPSTAFGAVRLAFSLDELVAERQQRSTAMPPPPVVTAAAPANVR
jgi:hypothetical protein